MLYRLIRPALFLLDPERAHGAALAMLKALPLGGSDTASGPLATTVAGIAFPNPLGMAAGFDKDGEVPDALLGIGFGFAEVGSITPLPQAGNPRPRLFRLEQDRAVINRMGFNNGGAEAAVARLAKRLGRPGVVGINIGANKDSTDRIADYATMARLMAPLASYLAVNVSSPNTPGLRALQDEGALTALLDAVLERAARKMQDSGVRLLWGTANLFGHPRYMAGAATNPDPEVFAWAAMQVRDALEATHRLGGANYVLWGGREGYDSILNTEIGIEQQNFGRFLSLVVDHKHRIGFKGTILIEPKPHEPTKHQYDFDTQTVYAFLKRFGLEHEVKVNIEANHATLSGHTFEHELAMARALGILGSIDANRGDPQNGWDTDQFPNSVEEITLAQLEVLRAGGLGNGGWNFDAKVRRQSIDAVDLMHGHIGGIDVIARGLLRAAALIEQGQLERFRAERYAGWQGELGRMIHAEGTTLAAVADRAVQSNSAPQPRSGRQEWCENLINRA